MSEHDAAQGTQEPTPQSLMPQLDDEAPRAYAALVTFATMPLATRTHSALALKLGVARTTVYRWAERYDWAARIDVWDRRQLVLTTQAARAQVDELSGEVLQLRQKLADVKAYAARTKASADQALSISLRLGAKLLKRIESMTDEEIAKYTARDLAALGALVPRLAESSILALGELHGAHAYVAFLTEQLAAEAPVALDEAEA